MKKLLPLIVIVALVAGAAWYFNRAKTADSIISPSGDNRTSANPAANGGQASLNQRPGDSLSRVEDGAGTGIDEEDIRPAVETYKSADEAFAAVKAGAADYDDITLERFVQLGQCSWCEEFYKTVTQNLSDAAATDDERAYYGEILAISGVTENLKTLVDAIQNAPNREQADIFAESLELAIGDDNAVNYLSEQFNSSNELIRESAIAAVTNQGSRLAAELLYKQTVENGDADGYYSLGIGLGEMVPEAEALPFLQQMVEKRDPYSQLALKAMLNEGAQGLRMVFDVLSASKNSDFDKEMLKDAIDHVSYDEETEQYLKKMADGGGSPVVVDFAKQILEDFSLDDEDQADADTEDADEIDEDEIE